MLRLCAETANGAKTYNIASEIQKAAFSCSRNPRRKWQKSSKKLWKLLLCHCSDRCRPVLPPHTILFIFPQLTAAPHRLLRFVLLHSITILYRSITVLSIKMFRIVTIV